MEASRLTSENGDESFFDYLPKLSDEKKKMILGGTAIALIGIAGYLGYNKYRGKPEKRKDSLSDSDLSLSEGQKCQQMQKNKSKA